MSEDSNAHVPAPRKPLEAYGRVDAHIMRDPSLPQQVKLVYAVVATYADKHREAYPSRDRLVRETGMGRGTVVAALRCGETAGLFEVRAEYTRDGVRGSTKGDGEQTSNRIALRDFGRGYAVGSGPGRTMPSSKRGPSVGRRGVQESDPGGSTVGPEQDHLSETTGSPTTTPSGEHVAAAAPAARDRPPKIMLHMPGAVDTFSPGQTAKYVMSAGAAAVKALGLTWSELGRKRLGRSAKEYVEAGGSPRRVVLLSGSYLQTAVVGGQHSWLLDTPKPAADADPDDFIAWAEMKAAVEEWKLEKFGEEFIPAEEGCATRMWVDERPLKVIDRKLRKMIRDDQAGPAKREYEWTRRHRVYSVSCDECEWPAGRLCRDDDGQPLDRQCHPCRFADAGVEPGAA